MRTMFGRPESLDCCNDPSACSQVYAETEKSSSNLNVPCVPAVTYPR